MRPARVANDENIPIADKHLQHNRHKSTGALSLMANATNTFKATAKRVALGDNMIAPQNNKPLTKNDSNIPGKFGKENLIKPSIMSTTGKPVAALLKPAQKPASTAVLQDVLNKTTGVSTMSSRVPLGNNSNAPQNNQPRKTTVKKSTTVFVDNPTANVSAKLSSNDQSAASSSSELAQTSQLKPRHHKSQPSLKEPGPNLRKTKSRILNLSDDRLQAIDHLARLQDEFARLRPTSKLSDVAEGDNEIVVPGSTVMPKMTYAESDPKNFPPQNALIGYTRTEEEDLAFIEEVRLREERQALEENAGYYHHNQLQYGIQPDEYWEEDCENDDDGYVTALSYRSWENATCYVTGDFIPQTNSHVEQDLAEALAYIESTRTFEEADDECNDVTLVMEYAEDIFQYMREVEIKLKPSRYYMDTQTEIRWPMRSVLMDWMVQVHSRLALLPETLFLTVNYVDRFLSQKVVSLGKLQLVGATALFIAAKYEEINCPNVSDIHFMVDGGYSKEELLKAERFMLNMLDHQLGWPGPLSFLRRISKADDYDLETRTLAKYFLEVGMMEHRFVAAPASYMAAAAHCLARFMLRKGDWVRIISALSLHRPTDSVYQSLAHIHYSGYTFAQLRQAMILLQQCCQDPYDHHSAVFEKYYDRKYKQASLFVEGQVRRGFQLPRVSYTKGGFNDQWYRMAVVPSQYALY
ncbi:MAG: hypothetical protein M1814_004811 [Vezdaea aestivalis]|nr:MAG: hypothetical protein M1814_004811 [Vezdaea aestivalis]